VPKQVWGGDPDHAHVWAEQIFIRNPTQVAQTKWQACASVATAQRAQKSSFCACGAWRGSLGLEPTPDLYVTHIVEVFRDVH